MLKVILTALAVCFAMPASAACISEAQAYLQLTNKYREVVVETEVRDFPRAKGVRMDMFVNEDTGTWTLIGTLNSISCGLTSGKKYNGQTIADILDGPDA